MFFDVISLEIILNLYFLVQYNLIADLRILYFFDVQHWYDRNLFIVSFFMNYYGCYAYADMKKWFLKFILFKKISANIFVI